MEENEHYINIIKFLVLSNQEGSLELCRLLFIHLKNSSHCGDTLGAISALSILIRVEPFRTVVLFPPRQMNGLYQYLIRILQLFIQHGGGCALLDLFYDSSIELVGEQITFSALGKVLDQQQQQDPTSY